MGYSMSDSDLELLESYIELTEKQSDIIHKLSQVIDKQATELAHLRNAQKIEDQEKTEE